MKKILITLTAVSLFAFTACSDDDDSGSGNGNGGGTSLTTQQKIVGAWNGDSLRFEVYANGVFVDSLTETLDLTGQTLTFLNSGDVYLDSAGSRLDTLDWSLIDDDHINFDEEVWHIEVLNTTNFNFSQDSSFTDTATSINFDIETTAYTTK